MLSLEQIEFLFTFCRKHFVYYYDVQIELVDHLANAVEEEIKADPKISFEKALEKVHQSFGVMGFAPLVTEKQKMAEKQSRKLFWMLFKEQFKWPKVITFFVLSAIMFYIFSAQAFLMKWFLAVIVLLSWPVFLFGILRLQLIIRRSGKKFLVMNFSLISSLILLPTYLINFSHLFKEVSFLNYTPENILIPGMSIFLSVYVITIIAVLQTFSSVRNSLYLNYPEVFSVIG